MRRQNQLTPNPLHSFSSNTLLSLNGVHNNRHFIRFKVRLNLDAANNRHRSWLRMLNAVVETYKTSAFGPIRSSPRSLAHVLNSFEQLVGGPLALETFGDHGNHHNVAEIGIEWWEPGEADGEPGTLTLVGIVYRPPCLPPVHQIPRLARMTEICCFLCPETVRRSFWRLMDDCVIRGLDRRATTSACLSLVGDKLRPHQVQNMIHVFAKEALGLRAMDMLTHVEWVARVQRGGGGAGGGGEGGGEGGGGGGAGGGGGQDGDDASTRCRTLPYTGLLLLDRGRFEPLAMPDPRRAAAAVGLDRQAHPVMDHIFTLILDEVGSGKTRSALSIVFINGPRGGNPHDIDLAEAREIKIPWRLSVPWTLLGIQPPGSLSLEPSRTLAMSAQIARLNVETYSARGGGTVIVVPHNMVVHWQKEIEALWEEQPNQPRVGIVGMDRLKKTNAISPQELAQSFDIIIVPSTLTAGVVDPNSRSPNCSVLTKQPEGVLWESVAFSLDDGRQYMFVGRFADGGDDEEQAGHEAGDGGGHEAGDGGGHEGGPSPPPPPEPRSREFLFIATSPFMRKFFDPATRILQVRPGFYPSSHLVAYNLAPDVVIGIFNGALGTGSWMHELGVLNRLPCRRILVKNIVVPQFGTTSSLSTRPFWEYAMNRNTVDLHAPMPVLAAMKHVRWFRLIVDEFHLFANPNTVKRKFVESLDHISFVGLTAQKEVKDWTFSCQMRWYNERINFLLRVPRALGTINQRIIEANALHNPVSIQCRPVVRTPIVVEPSAASVALASSLLERFREGMASRGLVVTDVGIAYSHLAHALKHIFKQESFADPLPTIEFLLAGLDNTLDTLAPANRRPRLHHADPSATAQAAIALDTDPASAVLSTLVAQISCPICFEDQVDPQEVTLGQWVLSIPCKHTMCQECYSEISNQRQLVKRCSMCRTAIQKYVYLTGPPRTSVAQTPSPAAPAASLAPLSGPTYATTSAGTSADTSAGAAADTSAGAAAAALGPGSSSKIDSLLSLLLQISEQPDFRGAVIFCDCSDGQMKRLMDVVARFAGPSSFRLHAIMSNFTKARREAVLETIQRERQSEEEPPRLLFVRYRMCAVGVNLIFANHVILFNMPHRADYLHQAVGRLCRLGQLSPTISVWPVVYSNCFETQLWQHWKHAAVDRRRRTQSTMAMLARQMVAIQTPQMVAVRIVV